MDRQVGDLAGEVCFRSNFFQTRERINYLIDKYISYKGLSDRLKDLLEQFVNSQPAFAGRSPCGLGAKRRPKRGSQGGEATESSTSERNHPTTFTSLAFPLVN